jgi:hypothetical protein
MQIASRLFAQESCSLTVSILMERFDRFADPNVVRDEQTHDVLPERHDQGNNLIGSWPERELGESAERTGAVALWFRLQLVPLLPGSSRHVQLQSEV